MPPLAPLRPVWPAPPENLQASGGTTKVTIGPTAQTTQTIFMAFGGRPEEGPSAQPSTRHDADQGDDARARDATQGIIAAVIGLVAVGLGVAALTATCEALLAAFFGAHHRALGPALAALLSLPSPKGGSVCVI